MVPDLRHLRRRTRNKKSGANAEGFDLLVEMVGRDFKWPHYTKELQDQEKPPAEADQRALVQQIQDVLKDYN